MTPGDIIFTSVIKTVGPVQLKLRLHFQKIILFYDIWL